MAKAVILKTNKGVRLMGTMQCSNGHWFDAIGCFNYCNTTPFNIMSEHQASKLIYSSTIIGAECTDDEWYKNKENFIDIEIDYETNQSYEL